MKTKTPVSTKKQPIVVKDLTTKKNPKGGAPCSPSPFDISGKGGFVTLNGVAGNDSLLGTRRKG